MGIEILTSIAISAAISAASYGVGKLLAKKPDKPAPTPLQVPQSPNPLDDSGDVGGPLPGLFGHRRIAGKALAQVKSNNVTYAIYVIAGAPVTGIDGVYLNNQLVTIDGTHAVLSEPWADTGEYSMYIDLYDGTQTSADAVIDAALPGWTSQFRGEQIAYAIVRMNPATDPVKFADTYSSGIPDIAFHVRGFKCYDPRDGGCVLGNSATYIFSVNPSIIEANYMIHPLGANLPTDLIDWDSVETSADIDDENVTLLSGGTERRYTAALYWMTDETHESVLARIGAAHAGGLRPIGKKYVMNAGAFTTPTYTIVADDYSGDGLTVTDQQSLSSRTNGVRGQFVSPGDNYEIRDFPVYQNATDRTTDGRDEWLEVRYECVTSHTQAQRLARIAYHRARSGYSVSLITKFMHFDITSGDTVYLTDALAGFSAVSFRVQEEELGDDLSIDFELNYEAASFFSWTAASDEQEYVPAAAIEGETGDIRPLGGALVDIEIGGTIKPAIIKWQSPSVIARASVHKTYENANLLNNSAPTFAYGGGIASYNAAASIAGNWKIDVADADAVTLTTMTIVVPGGVQAGAISDITEATTPYYTQPASPALLVISSGSGTATLRAPLSTSTRANQTKLYGNSVNNVATWSLDQTVAIGGSGTDFVVTGAPGSIRFYWAAVYNSVDVKEGPPSKPILIVF